MKKVLFFIIFLSLSCSQLADDKTKEIFMSDCNSNGKLKEYCECMYGKLMLKYSNNSKKAEQHDWQSDESMMWDNECLR